MRVALATCRALPDLDDDGPALLAALAARGVDAAPGVWDDPAFPWGEFDLVVVRSTWDYARQRDVFLAWVERVAALTPIANAPEILRWSTDKRYLRDLDAAGVATAETWWPEPGEPLPDLPDFVVKPAVSAGCVDTRRFVAAEREDAAAFAARIQADGRAAMVQPYLDAVDARGETALLFFAGRYSHAIRKGAMLERGGEAEAALFRAERIEQREATDAERALAERAVSVVPCRPGALLYARVDVVPGPDGAPVVLELELAEPSLFLGYSEGAVERFADAVVAHLGGASR